MNSDKRTAVVAALFEKKNKRKPKNSKELQDFVKEQGGEEFLKKVDDYISQAEAEQSKQAQKAAHGAKLQYVKSLKNQCADDEELVYYHKKGGVVCGCQKKKMQDGGPLKKKHENAVDKFKGRANQEDTVHVNKRIYSVVGDNGKVKDSRFPAYSKEQYQKDLRSKKPDAKKRVEKADMATAYKCGSKIKKAKCGAIAKFKAKKGSKIKVSC